MSIDRLSLGAIGPGLYVHVPFCRRRCGYCGFASSVYDAGRAARYLDALTREFTARTGGGGGGESGGGRRFRTVFVGGGTPTALGAEALFRLLTLLRTAADADAEISMEANPGGFDRELAEAAREGGVNRISFGAQSFNPRGLSALDRRQDPDDAARAVERARAAGIGRIGLDLIAGWPGQNIDDWRADLRAALALAPDHLSCYGLSVEEGTPLARAVASGAVLPPDEDFDRAAWDSAGELLEQAGLPRYEISNHARPGFECRHHLNYWTGGEYIGLGAAAHSHENGVRRANTADPEAYIAAWSASSGAKAAKAGMAESAEVFAEALPGEAKARETLTVWLRLAAGVDREAFFARTGFLLDELLARELPGLLSSGGLVWSKDARRLRLSDAAFPVADAVLSELVADAI